MEKGLIEYTAYTQLSLKITYKLFLWCLFRSFLLLFRLINAQIINIIAAINNLIPDDSLPFACK